MAAITERRFRRLLGGLDTAEFVAFVAGLWEARGYETRIEGTRVVAGTDSGRTVIAVRHDGSLVGRFTGVPTAEGVDAEVVVTSGDPERVGSTGDTDVLGASDLYDMALYGIDRERCAALFETHFGRPPAVQPRDRRWDRITARVRTVGVVAVVLLVAVVAAVAGPLGPVVPGGNADADPVTTPFGAEEGLPPTSTTTPATSTTAGPTTTTAVAPSTGALELANAHAAVLADRSFRVTTNHTRRTNGTVTAYSSLAGSFDLNTTRYSLTEIRGGTRNPRSRLDLWTENRRVHARVIQGNETNYRIWQNENGYPARPAEALSFNPVYVEDLPGLLVAVESVQITLLRGATEPLPESYSREPPETLGGILGAPPATTTSVFEVRANLSNAAVLGLDGFWTTNVRNATMTAVVDSNGRFHRYSVRYNTSLLGESFLVTQRVSFEDVGSTTVDRPAWYNRTRNGTGTTTG